MYKPIPNASFSNSHYHNPQQVLNKPFDESDNCFKAIFEKSPSGSLILAPDLKILQVNPALLVMLGVSNDAPVTGSSILHYAHPDHQTEWLILQNNLWVKQVPSFTIETCLRKTDGTAVWCKITCIVYQQAGTSMGYTIAEDISKRKADEAIIKASQANLLTILDNADSGYVLYNSRLEMVSFNALAQKFAAMLYFKQLKEGAYLLDYFPANRHEALLNTTEKVMRGENICYEHCVQDAGGKEIWMEVKWINVKDGEDRSWGFILASKNITEDKKAAMERERVNMELIQRNKTMEQFTNITSHNLRAPVANIIGLVELIEETTMEESEKKDLMSGILLSAKNLDTVISDINEILQIKMPIEETREHINLTQLVQDIKISISGMIIKEQVKISCNFETENVFGIRGYLYSIFYNMILNSIKYRSEHVEPHIALSAKNVKGKVILTFKDNGKGIDLKRHGDHLFGLYKRFDTTVQGKGLGLFMVKTQTEAMNGTISVSSEPGNGTQFTIELPA